MKKKQPSTVEETWPASKTELWPLDRIIPYSQNPRQHSAAQVELIARSMIDDGVTAPILVDEDGIIIYGHGRRMAAVKNEFARYPVVVARGWSEDQKRAARIKDNSYALLSTWSPELLRVELSDLSEAGYEMPLLGFDKVQLVSFMASVPSGGDPDAVPEPPKKAVSRLGDVWLMGKHRLLCGDSTKKEDVELVLNGEKPKLMVTDPPYGVDYDPAWRSEPGKLGAVDGSFLSTGGVRKGVVANDTRADWCESYLLFGGDVVYVWHGALYSSVVENSLHRAGFLTRAQIVWNKQHAPISRGDYHWKHECCWYMVRKGKIGNWAGDRKQNTVWDIANMNAFGGAKDDVKTEHGTQKPVECMKRPLLNNSTPGQFVYEPFSGSGTTMIACEMTTRYCLAIELDPVYIDVGVERWQTLTKQEATLEGDGRTFAEIAKARSKKAPARTGASRKGRRDQAAGAPQ